MEINRKQLRSELTELDKTYALYQKAKHSYPFKPSEKEQLAFEQMKTRIETKYGKSLMVLRTQLLSVRGQAFMKKFQHAF